MAILDPYVTIAEADVFLATSTVWLQASATQKDTALFWGRVWIDSNYTCPDLLADPTTPSELIKYANALLAEDHLQGTLINTTTSASGVKRKKLKAGSVEQETEYYADGGEQEVDYQEDVKLMLALECSFNRSGMIDLTRD